MLRENVEIVRASWEAWSRGDTDALFEFYDPEVEWDMTHSLVADMGVYHGHDGVREFFREWRAFFAEYHAEPEQFIDADESVVVRVGHRGRGRTSLVGVDVPALRCRPTGRSTGCVTVEPCASRSTETRPKPSKPLGCEATLRRTRTWGPTRAAARSAPFGLENRHLPLTR